MSKPSLFKGGDLCHCDTTIALEGQVCAVCRIEQTLDFNYVSNMLDMIEDDPYAELRDEDDDSD